MTDVGTAGTGPGAGPRLDEALLAEAELALRTRGWAYLSAVGFTDGTTVDHRLLLDVACRFGTPSDHDAGTAVWPVCARQTGEADTFTLRT